MSMASLSSNRDEKLSPDVDGTRNGMEAIADDIAMAPTPPQPVKVARIVFDLHGDVILVLTTPLGEAHFQINSAVLCLASTVFRAMLGINSCFKESQALASRRGTAGAPPVQIFLADDDPHALAVVLRMLHLQHEYIPASATPERLYQIAILCDKYDMRASLELWLDKWLPPALSGPQLSADKWLFMSYAFGKAKEFKRLTREAILNSRINDENALQAPSISGDWSCPITFNYYLPQPLLAEIQAIRQQLLETIIDKAHAQIESYTVNVSVKCLFQNEACDAIVLGILSKYLRKMKLYPEASNLMHTAVAEVKRLIDGLTYPTNVFLGVPAIQGCCSQPTACGGNRHNPNSGYSYAYMQSSACIYCSNNQCVSCSQTYKAPSVSEEKNHSSCSPVTRFKGEVDREVNKIEGLDYSRFVRNSAKGSKPDGAPPPTDLWSCLEYK